jgi:hypothetical protein
LLREMSTGNGIGRAEALRRSMAALVRENEPNAHPQIWAPFFVVGDGARGSRPAQPREGTAQPATSAGVSQPQQTLPPAAAVSVPPVPSRRPANSALPPAAATVPPAVAQTGSLPVDPAGEANPAQSSAPATAPAISLPFGIKIPLPASGPTALPSGQPDPFKVD